MIYEYKTPNKKILTISFYIDNDSFAYDYGSISDSTKEKDYLVIEQITYKNNKNQNIYIDSEKLKLLLSDIILELEYEYNLNIEVNY